MEKESDKVNTFRSARFLLHCFGVEIAFQTKYSSLNFQLPCKIKSFFPSKSEKVSALAIC